MFCIHRASDQSPATIISSSSPEAGFEEKHTVLYPGLRLISNKKENDEQDRECTSPQVPIICPIALKGKKYVCLFVCVCVCVCVFTSIRPSVCVFIQPSVHCHLLSELCSRSDRLFIFIHFKYMLCHSIASMFSFLYSFTSQN